MPTVYDWSPFFSALNGAIGQYGQRNQMNSLISSLSGTPGTPATPETPIASKQLQMPMGGTTTLDASLPALPAQGGTQGPLSGMNPAMLQVLKSAPPSVGLPLLLKLATKTEEYDPTPRYDQNGNAYLVDKAGNIKRLDGVKDRTKVSVADGMAYDPYNTAPGTQVGQPKAPTTREVNVGGKQITQEWRDGQWVQIAEAPRYKPGEGGNPGNVQSVQPLADGTLLIVKRDGTTAHVTSDGEVVKGAKYDPTNHFEINAAGAAGKAAGTSAESFPAVDANFQIINKTLDSFDDPAVRAQANHALGWQGKATLGASIPGVTSDFNARYAQLQGETFLNAYNTLRGGGQITEVEGEKATASIARLQKAQTPTEFYNALKDARSTFKTIYGAARHRAERGAVVPALQIGSGAQSEPTQNDPLGIR